MEQGVEDEVKYIGLRKFVAGALAGAAAKTTIAPLDRTKILMQISKMYGWKKHRGTVVSSLRDIVRSDGILGLFRGNSATVTRIMPHAAIQYTVFEYVNEKLAQKVYSEGSTNPSKRFLAGAIAGCCAVSITYPIDVAHTVLAVRTGQEKPLFGVAGERPGLINTIRGIVKKDGSFGLYRGVYPTFVGVVPLVGTRMATYGVLKNETEKYSIDERYKHLVTLFCGGTAGILSQCVTYPLDIVRKRLQALHSSDNMTSAERGFLRAGAGRGGKLMNFSIRRAILFVLRTEGIRGLYRGVQINFIKTAPALAVSVTSYDMIRKALGVPSGKYSATSSR